MTNLFLWSQILGGIAMLISIAAVQIKSLRAMRVMMFTSTLFRGTHFFLLGLPHAAIIEYVTGSRWLASVFTHRTWVKVLFILIILGIGLSIDEEWTGYLATLGAILGTLAAFSSSDRYMRVYLIIAMTVWVIHNVLVFSPIAIISSIFFLASTMIGYERFYHHRHIYLYPHQPVHHPKAR